MNETEMKPECPGCGKELNFPAEAVGRKIKCSACGFKSRIHATDGGTYYLTPTEEEVAKAPPPAPEPPRPRRPKSGSRRRRPAGGRRPAASTAESDEGFQPRPRKMNTPGPVLGAASVSALGGAVFIFWGIKAIQLASALADAAETADDAEAAKGAGVLAAVVFMIFGAAFLFLSLGLLKGNRVARGVQMTLMGLSMASSLYQVSQGDTSLQVTAKAGVALLVIALLILPESTEFFASGGMEVPKRGRRRRR